MTINTTELTTLIAKINSLQDRVEFSMYFGQNYTLYSDHKRGHFWSATLKFRDGDTNLEITKRGDCPVAVLDNCWAELEAISTAGLSAGALLPSVTQQLEDHTDEL